MKILDNKNLRRPHRAIAIQPNNLINNNSVGKQPCCTTEELTTANEKIDEEELSPTPPLIKEEEKKEELPKCPIAETIHGNYWIDRRTLSLVPIVNLRREVTQYHQSIEIFDNDPNYKSDEIHRIQTRQTVARKKDIVSWTQGLEVLHKLFDRLYKELTTDPDADAS